MRFAPHERRNTRKLALLACIALTATAWAETRAPWDGSRFRGRPDAPLPYRDERVYPSLEFEKPVVITGAPGSDRLFVAEQDGRIFSFDARAAAPERELFADLKSAIPELGSVYGLAFHPRFAENRLVFICYVLRGELPDGSIVSRFRVTGEITGETGEPPRCDVTSEVRVFRWRSGGHNGGCLKFGPDGALYISTGDGVGPYPPDTLRTGQDTSDFLSSILRIDVDRESDGRRYTVPADNPFVGVEGTRPEIWAFGFRNPWKMSFGPDGELWTCDVGWDLWELVFRVEKGGNYGWSVVEGRQSIHPDWPRGPSPILPPTADHPHTESRSITGGIVYRGSEHGDLVCHYVYADFETGKFWALRHDGSSVLSLREIADTPRQVVAFGEDLDRELLFLDYNDGGIYRLARSAGGGEESDSGGGFPRALSETGLFSSTRELVPAPGVVRYDVIVEPWEDGATSVRHLALPGDARATMRRNRCDFPEGTVLARTVSLAGRRVETQVLHRADRDWSAYAYVWNDAQTDAELAPAAGVARSIELPAKDGETRSVRWRTASRSECLLCHTFLGHTVLGFRVEQLARPVERDGESVDQLEHLARLGVFDNDPRGPARGVRPLCDPRDPDAPLDHRARSYLHVNCAPCHSRNGGGAAVFDLGHHVPLERTQTLDAPPRLGDFGLGDERGARIIAPGDALRSVVYYRMAALGSTHMPRVGPRRVDFDGLELVREWIESLDGEPASRPRALDRVTNKAADSPEFAAALDATLGSPRAALALSRDVARAKLSEDKRALAVERGLAAVDPRVRDLFRAFAPDDFDADRLGASFDPERVLALEGDVERGRALFASETRGRCATCHRAGDVDGGEIGPDLAKLDPNLDQKLDPGLDRRALLESIVNPSLAVADAYRLHVAVTRDGRVVSGIRAGGEEDGAIRLRTADGEVVRLERRELLTLEPQPQSLMPELLLRDFTAQEAADLLAFVVAVRRGPGAKTK